MLGTQIYFSSFARIDSGRRLVLGHGTIFRSIGFMDKLSHPGKNGTAFQVNWLVERLANLSKESSFSSFEARFVAFKSVICGGKIVITFRNSGKNVNEAYGITLFGLCGGTD